ncbi:hypothetical protein AK812_SmicGene26671 [Symbiodinium microadriaticum]|uniref:Uncharacterized protein n=1 Tax=Symbiodinium microadriaticum TaxID=2951 RepID=A0A1Q9D8V1_SYMMI|nr:hypothetical protein AK812_SmicGene26671 [Symbiodinium microadriaticum]
MILRIFMVNVDIFCTQAVSAGTRGSRHSLLGLVLWSLVGTGPRRAALGIFYAAVLLPTGLCADDLDSAHFNSSDDDMPELPVMQDSTRTCTMAWCHELSCQATHFSVSVAMLVDYVGRIAPMSFVRLHLWLPYLGPSVLEVSRAVTAAELEQQLSIAGHLPHHVLHIAFDTHSTTLDLLSVPDGPVTWWLVRDGLARELLRPVALWHAPGEQHFLTLNSHGQAFSVSQMTSHGLILFEVMRVWSFTCECPVDLPYVATPDPARLAAQIRDAGRGMPASGDFAWTTPRVVQDVAHMLHMPSRTVPPFAFWLLHFRAHGHVTAASGSTLDWQVLGLRAAEAFGGNCFSQGHFGVLQGGQLFLYGASLSAPPHGTILHLVRTYVPPRAGPTVWDTPTEPEVVMPFDYDICLSPAGTRAIDLRAAPTTVARQARTDESRPSASNTPELSLGQSLARQIEEVSHGLAVLTMRLESAGILPGEAPPTVEVVEAAPTERAADTSSAKTGAGWPGCACSLGLLLVVGMHSPPGFALALLVLGPCPFGLAQAARADGDDETLSHGPSEPRSPDLPDDFAAPTPRVEPVPTASGSLVLRPSGDAGAHTGLPGYLRSQRMPLYSFMPMDRYRDLLPGWPQQSYQPVWPGAGLTEAAANRSDVLWASRSADGAVGAIRHYGAVYRTQIDNTCLVQHTGRRRENLCSWQGIPAWQEKGLRRMVKQSGTTAENNVRPPFVGSPSAGGSEAGSRSNTREAV